MLATVQWAKVEYVRAWKVPRRFFARPCVTQPFRFGKRRRTLSTLLGNVRRWAEQVDFAFTLNAAWASRAKRKAAFLRLSHPAIWPSFQQVHKKVATCKYSRDARSGLAGNYTRSNCRAGKFHLTGAFTAIIFGDFPKPFLRRQWFRGFKRKRKGSSAWSFFLPTAKIRLLLLPKSTRVKNPINSMRTERTNTGAALWNYIFLSGVSKYDWWGSGRYVLLLHLLYMV